MFAMDWDDMPYILVRWNMYTWPYYVFLGYSSCYCKYTNGTLTLNYSCYAQINENLYQILVNNVNDINLTIICDELITINEIYVKNDDFVSNSDNVLYLTDNDKSIGYLNYSVSSNEFTISYSDFELTPTNDKFLLYHTIGSVVK